MGRTRWQPITFRSHHSPRGQTAGGITWTNDADGARIFRCCLFIGQHARTNREAAVMAHSYSSLGLQQILMNGNEVGEIETRTALAGWFGVPVILLTGDQAAAEDLLAIVPSAETAVVKEGLSYYSCISLSATAAQRLVEEISGSFWEIAILKVESAVLLFPPSADPSKASSLHDTPG